MVNKNEKEIGTLNIFSWEHFALTGHRYCQNVDELKWLLPSPFFKKLLTLQQEFILSNCIQLDPLVDHRKRNIFLKSQSFKKTLTEESKEFTDNNFPLAQGISFLLIQDLIDSLDLVFEEFEDITFKKFFMTRKSDELANWEEYVFKNTGYSTGHFRKGECNNLHYEFWVPGLNCKIKQYYYVQWQPVFGEEEVLKILFDADE